MIIKGEPKRLLRRALNRIARVVHPMPQGSSGSAAPGPKPLSTGETLRWAALFLRPYKWRAAVNPSFAVLSVAFAIAFPQLTQYIVDDLNDHRLESLLPSVLMLLLVFLCRDLSQSIRLMVNNRFEQNVVHDMRCAVYEQLQKLPMSYLSERASGDLINAYPRRYRRHRTAVDRGQRARCRRCPQHRYCCGNPVRKEPCFGNRHSNAITAAGDWLGFPSGAGGSKFKGAAGAR